MASMLEVSNEVANVYRQSANVSQLMTRCITVDQAMLEKTKLDKVLVRVVRRGDDQGKRLAQIVLDNAEAATKKKTADGTPLQPPSFKGTAMTRPPATGPRASEASSSSKKPRSDQVSDTQSLKKQATSTSQLGQVSTKLAGAASDKHQTVKVESKLAAKPIVSATPVPKIKTNHVVAKPSAFFSSLQSASKKPGTSNAALQSTKSKEGKPTYVHYRMTDFILYF